MLPAISLFIDKDVCLEILLIRMLDFLDEIDIFSPGRGDIVLALVYNAT